MILICSLPRSVVGLRRNGTERLSKNVTSSVYNSAVLLRTNIEWSAANGLLLMLLCVSAAAIAAGTAHWSAVTARRLMLLCSSGTKLIKEQEVNTFKSVQFKWPHRKCFAYHFKMPQLWSD